MLLYIHTYIYIYISHRKYPKVGQILHSIDNLSRQGE